MFWFVSMLSTSIVWITLAYLFSGKGKSHGGKAIKQETRDDASSIKDEDEDEDSGDLSRFPPEPTKTGHGSEDEDESPRSDQASTSETEDASNTRDTRHGGGMGTGVQSAGEQGVQRRRSRMFESEHS